MRPSDPRVIWNAWLVTGLFWHQVWADFLTDLSLAGGDGKTRPEKNA